MGDGARRLAFVVGSVALVVTSAACTPAGRHANRYTLPFVARRPFGVTEPCSVLAVSNARIVRAALFSVGRSRFAEGTRRGPGGRETIVVRPRVSGRRYGIVLPCQPPSVSDVVRKVRMTLFLKSVSVPSTELVAGASSGGLLRMTFFAQRQLRLDSRWRRVTLSGTIPPLRETVELYVASGRRGGPAFEVTIPRITP